MTTDHATHRSITHGVGTSKPWGSRLAVGDRVFIVFETLPDETAICGADREMIRVRFRHFDEVVTGLVQVAVERSDDGWLVGGDLSIDGISDASDEPETAEACTVEWETACGGGG